jgi:hypothetical protein
VTDSNLRYLCTSGWLLHAKLIGNFPGIVTTGVPVTPASTTSPPAFTVHAVVLTADGETGRACLESVQIGDVSPDPGSVILRPG